MICVNIDDSAVFSRYISPLYDHPIACDWAKIVSKIGRKFAAFCRSHCSKWASAAAAKCGIMRVSPPENSLQYNNMDGIQYEIRNLLNKP